MSNKCNWTLLKTTEQLSNKQTLLDILGSRYGNVKRIQTKVCYF